MRGETSGVGVGGGATGTQDCALQIAFSRGHRDGTVLSGRDRDQRCLLLALGKEYEHMAYL
jgi:hypothetical protein